MYEPAQSEYADHIMLTGCTAYGTTIEQAQDEEHEYDTIPLSPVLPPPPAQGKSSTVTPQTSDNSDYEDVILADTGDAPTQTSGARIVSASGNIPQGRADD